MIPSETLEVGTNFTWSVSPDYIELKDERMALRIPNHENSHIRYKVAGPILGECIIFYGADDMKLYIEEKNTQYIISIFHGRKQFIKYTNKLFGPLFRLMKLRYGPIEERVIPKDSTNAVTFHPISNGTIMVDFDNEFRHGRYYTRETYDRLPSPKINPFTRKEIHRVSYYKAKLSD